MTKISITPKEIKFEWNFPPDFCVIVDTRENQQLFRRPPKGLMIVRDTLKYGDYSIRGFETSITVERKEMLEFIGEVGSDDHDDFRHKLIQMSGYERKWLLIHATEKELLHYDYKQYSYGPKVHHNVVRGSLASIQGRIGVPVYFAQTRPDAERWLLDVFVKFYRMKKEGKT
jgi:DNA excision repair protein ERCC-4